MKYSCHIRFIAFLSILLFLMSACTRKSSDLEERLTSALDHQNDRLEQQFNEGCRNLVRKFEEAASSGNIQSQAKARDIITIQKETRELLLSLEHATNLTEESPADSVIAILNRSEAVNRRFWSKNAEQNKKSIDSTGISEVINAAELFSENRREFWANEFEIIRSQFIEDGFSKIDHFRSYANVGGYIVDTLTFEDFLPENPVVAGTDAKVFLRVVKRIPQLQPHFEGSGSISSSPSDGTALMIVKTSEEMIPEGQEDAFVSYQATVKIPTADGGQLDYRLTGKVKIIRPCDPR
jgi:hypothetical protein